MYLGPLLDGQCLRDYPPRISHSTTEIVQKNETALGNRYYHRIGFHFTFTLDWNSSLISESMYSVLISIINKNRSLTFIPYPDKYINSVFTVRIINGLAGIAPYRHLTIGYRGSLNLETTTPVQQVPDWTV